MLLQRQVSLALVLKEIRDKIRSLSAELRTKQDQILRLMSHSPKGFWKKPLEREGDRLRERRFNLRDGSRLQG